MDEFFSAFTRFPLFSRDIIDAPSEFVLRKRVVANRPLSNIFFRYRRLSIARQIAIHFRFKFDLSDACVCVYMYITGVVKRNSFFFR